jgi:hypothetical protein
MAAAQHKLSRRDLLAAACAGVALPLPCHSGLDPESILSLPPPERRRTPDQVRGDEGGEVRRDGAWQKALARYGRAVAGLEAVAHSEDDDLYDRALGRHNGALDRLLRTRAPDLAATAGKLDLILRHSVFELTFGEASLAALQRDLRRFAGL